MPKYSSRMIKINRRENSRGNTTYCRARSIGGHPVCKTLAPLTHRPCDKTRRMMIRPWLAVDESYGMTAALGGIEERTTERTCEMHGRVVIRPERRATDRPTGCHFLLTTSAHRCNANSVRPPFRPRLLFRTRIPRI